jgi:uncharacterized membrane protein YeaQ/YmgE (transglycosylase-associated protein family)
MFIMAWLAMGLVAGFVVGQLVNRSGEGLLFDCLLGVVGAVGAGWAVHRYFGGPPMTDFTMTTALTCIGGGVLCVLGYHFLLRRDAA